ncbi:MAG TPA: OmpA family protein [Gemmatimonadales bacterium]|nr:OmpA family protein [Gemmatimonadales bacterium]
MKIAALLWAAVGSLAAQGRARQFEFGAFGAYTRYDDAFGLDDVFGGGARFGYFFTDQLGLEVDVLFQSQQRIAGTSTRFEPLIGGGSLLFNLPVGNVSTLYALGGYSRLDFGTTDPYRFTDGGIHGGAGVRVSLSQRAALRFEARYLYTPETRGAFGRKSASHLVGSLGFSVFHSEARPRPAPTPAPPLPTPAAPAPAAPEPVPERDSDSDGVLDGPDRCPDTPLGATVDPSGCPMDGDGDAVFDGIDRCPDTPRGAVVDARGCPTDSDGDRVYDGIDQCPNTPPGAAVDARGCTAEVVQAAPDPDTDKDGVLNETDRCPNTPPGSTVDQFGCIVLFREEPGERATPLVLQGVNFATGRSIIMRESYPILDAVAASLVANPDVRIEIAGHTDNTGSETLNLRLSQARAAAVRHYLATKGVAVARMVARGYGESEPVADNSTPEGRARNRRVELRRIN